MKRTTYAISTIRGPEEVAGLTQGDIGIHRVKEVYLVTHLPTGYRLCWIPGFKAAKEAAAAIANLCPQGPYEFGEYPNLEVVKQFLAALAEYRKVNSKFYIS